MDAPVPLKTTLVPAQTVADGKILKLIIGRGFTVIVVVAVFEQPFGPTPVTV